MACSTLTIQIITVGTISRSRLAYKTQVTYRPLATLMLKTAMLPFLWELLRPGVNKKQFACSNPCRKFQYWNIIAFSTCVTNWTFRRLDSIVCSLNIIQYMVFGKLKIFDRSFLIWCDESQLAICVYGETYYSPQSGSITVPNFSAGSVSGISPGAGRGGCEERGSAKWRPTIWGESWTSWSPRSWKRRKMTMMLR